MKRYYVGEVYEVRTPHNCGIYKITKIEGDLIWYKSATPYLSSPPFHVDSNFSEKSVIIPDIDVLNDDIIERLNAIALYTP